MAVQYSFAFHVFRSGVKTNNLVATGMHLIEKGVSTVLLSMLNANVQGFRVSQLLWPDVDLIIVRALDEVYGVVDLEAFVFAGLLELRHLLFGLFFLILILNRHLVCSTWRSSRGSRRETTILVFLG